MRYWITTHWPPLADSKREYGGIYIPDGKQAAAADLAPGDRILIYETQSAPAELRHHPDGREEWVKHLPGQGGIFAICEARKGIRYNSRSATREYRGGRRIRWCWQGETTLVNASGFVPRSTVNRMLGFSPAYTLHGFGRGSGVREITEEEYLELVEAFKQSRPAEKAPPPTQEKGRHDRAGTGAGEGPEHKALKEAIFRNPSAVLAEPGLVGISMEHEFPTGDRIDVVLEDADGRYVTVEVEISVPDDDRTGILQAIKYKHMYAFQCNRMYAEIRAVVAAKGISDRARRKAADYSVECIVTRGK